MREDHCGGRADHPAMVGAEARLRQRDRAHLPRERGSRQSIRGNSGQPASAGLFASPFPRSLRSLAVRAGSLWRDGTSSPAVSSPPGAFPLPEGTEGTREQPSNHAACAVPSRSLDWLSRERHVVPVRLGTHLDDLGEPEDERAPGDGRPAPWRSHGPGPAPGPPGRSGRPRATRPGACRPLRHLEALLGQEPAHGGAGDRRVEVEMLCSPSTHPTCSPQACHASASMPPERIVFFLKPSSAGWRAGAFSAPSLLI